MDPIRLAIERPVAVVAIVMMAVMFGVLALTSIPIQLTPDVRKPVIEIRTIWPGAAPAEVEREIVNEQEDVLKGLEGLEEITSRAQTGRGTINLEFAIGTNMDRALLLVANRLDRVSSYPDEAQEPTLDTSGSDDNPIACMMLQRGPGVPVPPIVAHGMIRLQDHIANLFRLISKLLSICFSLPIIGRANRGMWPMMDRLRWLGEPIEWIRQGDCVC